MGMEFHGILLEFDGIPIQFHGILLDFYGIPRWDSMEKNLGDLNGSLWINESDQAWPRTGTTIYPSFRCHGNASELGLDFSVDGFAQREHLQHSANPLERPVASARHKQHRPVSLDMTEGYVSKQRRTDLTCHLDSSSPSVIEESSGSFSQVLSFPPWFWMTRLQVRHLHWKSKVNALLPNCQKHRSAESDTLACGVRGTAPKSNNVRTKQHERWLFKRKKWMKSQNRNAPCPSSVQLKFLIWFKLKTLDDCRPRFLGPMV